MKNLTIRSRRGKVRDMQFRVLNNGFIRLDGVEASDLSVVNSARVSFGKRKDKMEEADAGLINFLLSNKHGTPFEHNFFRFHVKAPIFVAREWFRHRIGWSYNEYSGRYSEMTLGAYTPDIEDFRTQVGKPGSYSFEELDADTAMYASKIMMQTYEICEKSYASLLENGVAKEVARSVLPVATWTEFYASTNARALMNFINLRADETAQYEIRQYAEKLLFFLEEHMPYTYKAFIKNNRVAP